MQGNAAQRLQASTRTLEGQVRAQIARMAGAAFAERPGCAWPVLRVVPARDIADQRSDGA